MKPLYLTIFHYGLRQALGAAKGDAVYAQVVALIAAAQTLKG